MSEFIKVGENVIPIPKGIKYQLEPGKVYDLKIYVTWGTLQEQFQLNGDLNTPNKLYLTNKDSMFIDRVVNEFNNTTKNTTGVLLVGDKGSGKTVTAKVIAEKANLPIIIVNQDTDLKRLTDFFKKFDTPVCILFDEVDKVFDTEELLTFLDGLKKTCKKLIVMTGNESSKVSDYLKDRCSRIRYYRNYNVKEDAAEYTKLICEDKKIENSEEIVNFIINNIKFPSIDNILTFIEEYINTRSLNISLEEVLQFLNINVSTEDN